MEKDIKRQKKIEMTEIDVKEAIIQKNKKININKNWKRYNKIQSNEKLYLKKDSNSDKKNEKWVQKVVKKIQESCYATSITPTLKNMLRHGGNQ